MVVEADPPAWPRTVVAWVGAAGGRIARWRLLEDEDEVLELEPAYVIRAPYRVFRRSSGAPTPSRPRCRAR